MTGRRRSHVDVMGRRVEVEYTPARWWVVLTGVLRRLRGRS